MDSTTTEEQVTYGPVGRCTYSALYQTFFKGQRMIKRFLVARPIECFAGCYYEGCRSVNLIKNSKTSKFCELYRDSLIDYRTPNNLGYDSNSAYFYGIQCGPENR
uniref:Apple domain-containing protein n=1 Tax=Syphacia muris TaxID=451379 RepID=A0A0N5ACI1_9BILA